jgi:hypothetical protein
LNRGKNCQSGVSDSAKQMIPTFQKIFETKKEKIKFKLLTQKKFQAKNNITPSFLNSHMI